MAGITPSSGGGGAFSASTNKGFKQQLGKVYASISFKLQAPPRRENFYFQFGLYL